MQLGFLSLFDPVFVESYKCMLKPPYTTAKDLLIAMEGRCKRGLQSKFIIRHNRRKAKKK